MYTLWFVLGDNRICIKKSDIIPRIGEFVNCDERTLKVSNIYYTYRENVVCVYVKKTRKSLLTAICIGKGIVAGKALLTEDKFL